MSWLLLQGLLLIFNVLGTTESYVSCRVVVLTALCVVMAVYAATARTTYDALTVVDICLYIVTRTLVSSVACVCQETEQTFQCPQYRERSEHIDCARYGVF